MRRGRRYLSQFGFLEVISWWITMDLSLVERWEAYSYWIYLVVCLYWKLNSTLCQPSSFSHHTLSVFPSLFLSRLKEFFIDNIYDLSVFLPSFLIKFWRFFIDWYPCPTSFSNFPHWVERFFTNNMILFETHQLPYGARIFSFVFWFSFSIHLIGWEIFYQVPTIQVISSKRQLLHLAELMTKKKHL